MKEKGFLKPFLMGIIFLAIMTMFSWGPLTSAVPADTTNYSEVVTGVQIVSLPIMGQYTATRTGLITLQMPFKAKVLGVSAKARASSGTSPTLTIDVKEGAASILSAPFSVYSGSITEGTVSDTTLADESTVSLDLAIGGTSPVWEDITTTLTIRRTN